MEQAELVTGNSSSGIIEEPSFYVPTVNIGERQKGRLSADGVIHCNPNKEFIELGNRQAKTLKAENNPINFKNPYGDGEVSSRVVKIIKGVDLSANKSFYDIEVVR